MTGRGKYLVFWVGMVVLALGVSISVWILLTRSSAGTEPLAGNTPLSLPESLEQILGLSEEEAGELAQRFTDAALSDDLDTAPREEISLAQALEQIVGLSEEEAGELAQRLKAAAPSGRLDTSPGEELSLGQALEQALGVSEEEAGALVEQLEAAADQAAAPPTGSGDNAGVSESLDYEVRDASGNLIQQGSGR